MGFSAEECFGKPRTKLVEVFAADVFANLLSSKHCRHRAETHTNDPEPDHPVVTFEEGVKKHEPGKDHSGEGDQHQKNVPHFVSPLSLRLYNTLFIVYCQVLCAELEAVRHFCMV